MRLGRGALIIGSGLLITFIGLILWNIPLPEEGNVSLIGAILFILDGGFSGVLR